MDVENKELQGQLFCGKCGGTYYSAVSFCGFDGFELIGLDPPSNPDSATSLRPPTGKECEKCRRKYPLSCGFCGADGASLRDWHDDSSRQAVEVPEVSSEPEERTMTASINRLAGWATRTLDLKSGSVVEPQGQDLQLPADQQLTSGLNLIGKTIDGKYLIQSVLAEGGMSVLYKAEQIAIERTVVIKVVHGSLMTSDSELQRFSREAKLMAKLNHPNIVAVYDAGLVNERMPYLAMEYISGTHLANKIKENGLPPIQVAAHITMQICRGLKIAHDASIIHRDLKPENIILQEDFERPDWVKIVDFGIAHLLEKDGRRLTMKGYMVGTPEYVAPELLNDQEPDNRCDIYSLGVVMFEMLTGKRPFEARDIGALMAKVLTEPAPSISALRTDIETDSCMELAIRRCLEKEPSKRFQTVSELMSAIQPALL